MRSRSRERAPPSRSLAFRFPSPSTSSPTADPRGIIKNSSVGTTSTARTHTNTHPAINTFSEALTHIYQSAMHIYTQLIQHGQRGLPRHLEIVFKYFKDLCANKHTQTSSLMWRHFVWTRKTYDGRAHTRTRTHTTHYILKHTRALADPVASINTNIYAPRMFVLHCTSRARGILTIRQSEYECVCACV